MPTEIYLGNLDGRSHFVDLSIDREITLT